jgi:hypothetical protein
MPGCQMELWHLHSISFALQQKGYFLRLSGLNISNFRWLYIFLLILISSLCIFFPLPGGEKENGHWISFPLLICHRYPEKLILEIAVKDSTE